MAALKQGALPTYIGCRLTEDDRIRQYVIRQIMCDFELDFATVEKKFEIDFEKYFEWGLGNFDQMLADNMMTIENRKISVTDMGRLLIRNIAMNFDGYLERKEDQGRYSRTV